MRLFKQLFDFYLKASIHVALAVFSMVYIGAKSLNIPMNSALALIAFCGTIVVYNFIKYGVGATQYWKVTKKSFIPIQILSSLAGFFGIYGVVSLPSQSFLVVILMSIMAGLYALPMLPSKKNLRTVSGLKMSLVAAVWAIASVCLPLSTLGKISLNIAESSPFFWVGVLSLLLAHFAMVWVLMVPFEIRDFKTDPLEVKNIVQRLGLKKTKIIGLLWVFIFLALQQLNAFIFEWSVEETWIQWFLGLILTAAIFAATRFKSSYFANFWVESIPILYALGWFLI